MFTPHSLSEFLTEIGFQAVEVIGAGQRNGKRLEFALKAKKPL
jgi:hypothetical protein